VYRSKAPSLLLLVVLSLCASVDVRLSYEILLAPKCMCKCKHNAGRDSLVIVLLQQFKLALSF
jgi:hypothetical protein